MESFALARTWYYRDNGRITITFNFNAELLKDPKTLRAVMLHEMCHAVQYQVFPEETLKLIDTHEAKEFEYERDRLIKYFNEWVW